MDKQNRGLKTASTKGAGVTAARQTDAVSPTATAQEDAAMIATILSKAKSGSVDHAKLLAEKADYAPRGVFAAVNVSDLQAVITTMAEKAQAGDKGAARLLPKLEKALAVVKSRVAPPVTRG
jgi:hypothetical protein